jgi:hypothetical protein
MKRLKNRNRNKFYWTCLGLATVLGLSALLWAQADFAVGTIIRSFEFPQRDRDGNLKLRIQGREATVMSLNRINIRGLTITLFSQDNAQTIITANLSDFWRAENRLTVEDKVQIKNPSIVVESQTMDWDLGASKGVFKGGVRVTILEGKQL